MKIITTATLRAFARYARDPHGYRGSVTVSGRRVHLMCDRNVASTREAFAYLVGRFTALHPDRDLSPEWEEVADRVASSIPSSDWVLCSGGGESSIYRKRDNDASTR